MANFNPGLTPNTPPPEIGFNDIYMIQEEFGSRTRFLFRGQG